MPLQQLVIYFNHRFEQEHRSSFHPLILQSGRVCGLFGPIKVGSEFIPVRRRSNPAEIVGHTVACSVMTHDVHDTQKVEIENSHNDHEQPADFDSIINLDRLCRTVHMLNYLPIVHFDGILFLDVDQRHILGIKRDHGAYFEDVIAKCGLANHNVVISMNVNRVYLPHHEQLLAGLTNYRRRGYRIALNIGSLYSANWVLDLIARTAPDYIRVHAPRQFQVQQSVTQALNDLKGVKDSVGAQTIMRIDRGESDVFTQLAGFDLVEGGNVDIFSGQQLPEVVGAAVPAYPE